MAFTTIDEQAIVGSHQAGDPDAFPAIVREHYPALLARARRRLRSQDAAEDAVQETFLRAYRALPRFGGEYRLSAWLFRILDNVCADEGSRRQRTARLVDRLAAEPTEAVEPSPEASVEPEQWLRSIIDALPQAYRDALVLREVEGLPYSEVAAAAGISEDNARARVSRARTALRRALGPAVAVVAWLVAILRRSEKVLVDTAGSSVGAATVQLTPAATQLASYVGPTSTSFGTAAKVAAAVVAAAVPLGGAAVVDQRNDRPAAVERRLESVDAAPASPQPAAATSVAPATEEAPPADAPSEEASAEPAAEDQPAVDATVTTSPEEHEESPRGAEPASEEEATADEPPVAESDGTEETPVGAGAGELSAEVVESARDDGRIDLSAPAVLETDAARLSGRLLLVCDLPDGELGEGSEYRIGGSFLSRAPDGSYSRVRFYASVTEVSEVDGLRVYAFAGRYAVSDGEVPGLAAKGELRGRYVTGGGATPTVGLRLGPVSNDGS